MNALTKKITRQFAEGWNPENEDNSEYDDLQEPISTRNQETQYEEPSQTEDPDMELLDSMMEQLFIEDFSELQRDARPNFMEEEYVKYFNKLHKVSYTKEQVDEIYSLSNKYNINTYYAIDYYCHCHACGTPLANIGSSFCESNCKNSFGVEENEERYDCAWGDCCRMCFEPEECTDCQLKIEHEDRYLSYDNRVYCGDCIENNDIKCFVCEKQMFEKEGYISGKNTYCCKCAVDVFDYNTCELEKQGDKELEIEARAIRIRREREFYTSYDESQDYFLWFEEQKKKYGDDPEFMAMFHISEFTVNAVVSNEELEYPHFTVGAVLSNEDWEKKESDDRTKRSQEFYASYDGIEDYFVWLEDQKKKHGNDPEFQKSYRMFHRSVDRRDNSGMNNDDWENALYKYKQKSEDEENNKNLIATEDAAEMGDEFYEDNQYLSLTDDDDEVYKFRTSFTSEESEIAYQCYINSLSDSKFVNEGFMNEETGVWHPGKWEFDEKGINHFYPQMDDVRNIEYFGTGEQEERPTLIYNNKYDEEIEYDKEITYNNEKESMYELICRLDKESK